MPATAIGHPLSALRDGVIGFASGESHPVPLTRTEITVAIKSGLALVSTTRSFRNVEAVPIEAVMTFPVGFDTVVTGLTAQVGDRQLVAKAKPREQAREQYEGALEQGKLAVLHEEALRGIHVLSVGQLAPGTEVRVRLETMTPLSLVDGVPGFRIPTTVGQIYGHSPLLPSDELSVSDAFRLTASLSVDADTGIPQLADGTDLMADVPLKIPLDRAIHLRCPGGHFGTSRGRDARGGSVAVTLTPEPVQRSALAAHILVDHSGSTSAQVGSDGESVHASMCRGLRGVLDQLGRDDQISLWQFDDHCTEVGAASGPEAAALVRSLAGPAGGTQLGSAVSTVVRAGARDVLVLTDGQTWAAESHEAAARGCRISAVLVGEGSLDANIGHLAAMTGGSVFCAAGAEVGPAIRAAIASLRSPTTPASGTLHAGRPASWTASRGGITIAVQWADNDELANEAALTAGEADAVGRFAAAFALPLLKEEAASDYASAHGLCSHLTSLVLVDEAGAVSEGLPEFRKVPLMAEACMARDRLALSFRAPSFQAPVSSPMASARSTPPKAGSAPFVKRVSLMERLAGAGFRARQNDLIDRLPWARMPNAFLAGDLSMLNEADREAMFRLAALPEVQSLALDLKVDPVAVVVALLLTEVSDTDPRAFRFRARVLGTETPGRLALTRAAIRRAQ